MISNFEKPKTKESFLSISVTATDSPNVAERRAESSSPPNPAPRMTT
jgi:hypothetical protein